MKVGYQCPLRAPVRHTAVDVTDAPSQRIMSVVVTSRPGEPALWGQVLTGMELDEDGVVSALDGPCWLERRRRLERLGGPPRP
jgi:hypothetical protein